MSSKFILFFVVCFLALLLAFSLWPDIDLAVSGLFADQNGFYLQDNAILNGLTKTAFYGARLLFVILLLGTCFAYARKKAWLGLQGRAWLFLLLSLLIGPGLLANVVFKDHWGRARPRTVMQFGGSKSFTPAGVISQACERNCSFVSGDAAFGFFLPAFAYLVPLHRRKRVFWSLFGVGSLFAAARVILGAHFLSDVLYAMIISLGAGALVHAIFFGRQETSRCWKSWLPLLVNQR